MSNFQNKGKFLGAKITPYNVMRNIGMNWSSDGIVPEHILNEGVPYQGELLLQAGGFKYDTDTHTIESRITPKFNATLKQGLVAKGNGTTSEINYGVRDLCDGGCNDFSIKFRIIDLGAEGLPRYPIAGEYTTTANKRGWAITTLRQDGDAASINIGKADGTFLSFITITFTNAIVNGDLVELRFTANGDDGLWTAYKNGVANGTEPQVGQNLIYSNGADFQLFAYLADRNNQTISDMEIRRNGTLVFKAPLNGSGIDIVNGWVPTETDVEWVGSDSSTFDCNARGFAVQTDNIFPRNLANTGYAGLVGEPDITFQGLIATKGKPEIGMNDYLGTLYDFGNSAEIVGAGIDWSGWDNADCNLDLVGTAETNLDTDYYNAITSSLMSCEGMIYGGTSNVAQRMFFKVSNLVMKADGSFLASSGTVTDILVYKRDLCLRERINVLKWCNALPFQSVELVKDGDDFVVIDDNFTYVCL